MTHGDSSLRKSCSKRKGDDSLQSLELEGTSASVEALFVKAKGNQSSFISKDLYSIFLAKKSKVPALLVLFRNLASGIGNGTVENAVLMFDSCIFRFCCHGL